MLYAKFYFCILSFTVHHSLFQMYMYDLLSSVEHKRRF